MILSGMSNMTQIEDKLRTFFARRLLTGEETQKLLVITESMKDSVPCTACRYCMEHCPMGLNIPMLLSVYNDIRFAPGVGVALRIEHFLQDKQPSACIGCGACAAICPQKIDIPEAMRDLLARLR